MRPGSDRDLYLYGKKRDKRNKKLLWLLGAVMVLMVAAIYFTR